MAKPAPATEGRIGLGSRVLLPSGFTSRVLGVSGDRTEIVIIANNSISRIPAREATLVKTTT